MADNDDIGILRAKIEDLERRNADLLRVAQGRALPAVTVGVKPLVWDGDTAKAFGAMWMVWHYRDPLDNGLGQWLWQSSNVAPHRTGCCKTREEAVEKAEADYEARILAALEPQPAALAVPGVKPLIYALHQGSKIGVCIGGRWHGWVMVRHPDGYWVSDHLADLIDPAQSGSNSILAALTPTPVDDSQKADPVVKEPHPYSLHPDLQAIVDKVAPHWDTERDCLVTPQPTLAEALAVRALVEYAKAHEAWEAKLIMEGDWSGDCARLTQELHDEMINVQRLRNDALAALRGVKP